MYTYYFDSFQLTVLISRIVQLMGTTVRISIPFGIRQLTSARSGTSFLQKSMESVGQERGAILMPYIQICHYQLCYLYDQ